MKREKLQFVAGSGNKDIFKSVDVVYSNFTDLLVNPDKQNIHLVSLIFFVNTDKDMFYKVRKYIISKAATFSFIPTISVIGQPPADGSDVLVEVEVIKDIETNTSISYESVSDGIYLTKIETPQSIEYNVYGITIEDENATFDHKVFKAFEILDNVLINQGLGMNNIVRQWNYVEDIVGFTSPECGSKQNYQILNNIRHEFYCKYDFANGFPAATGIGMALGAFVLDCIAIKEKTDLEITPIKNPVQVCAYDYSEKVLIGSKTEKNFPRLSPKFERAKLFRSDKNYSLLISGTAAIHNEISLAKGDPAKQTEITLENIDKLIEVASGIIEKTGKIIDRIAYPYLRVYIKNSTDYWAVKNICEKHTKQIDPVYLIGDICRAELLVEIEGVISIDIK